MATLNYNQIEKIEQWCKNFVSTKKMPESFNVEIAILNSINNAGDVDPEFAEDCAKDTFVQYVDAKVHQL